MTLTSLVSYDGSPTDRDALSLAGVFAELGAKTVLTYVRHNAHATDGQTRLDRGAAFVAGADTRVVDNPSTSEGLKSLVSTEGAGVIVFGSDYRTPTGRVSFQKSASTMLDGGNAAIAIAPAGYEPRPIRHIGLVAGLDDHAAIDTAHAIATHYGATVTDKVHGVDLLIFGSRAEAKEGRVLLSSRNEITVEEDATSPVLIVARGAALDFASQVYVA